MGTKKGIWICLWGHFFLVTSGSYIWTTHTHTVISILLFLYLYKFDYYNYYRLTMTQTLTLKDKQRHYLDSFKKVNNFSSQIQDKYIH